MVTLPSWLLVPGTEPRTTSVVTQSNSYLFPCCSLRFLQKVHHTLYTCISSVGVCLVMLRTTFRYTEQAHFPEVKTKCCVPRGKCPFKTSQNSAVRYYLFCFADDEAEVQKGKITCPRSFLDTAEALSAMSEKEIVLTAINIERASCSKTSGI